VGGQRMCTVLCPPTPFQFIKLSNVNAYATLANGGTVYQPRLIKQLESSDGDVVKVFQPEKLGVLPVRPGGQEGDRNLLCPEENDANPAAGAGTGRRERPGDARTMIKPDRRLILNGKRYIDPVESDVKLHKVEHPLVPEDLRNYPPCPCVGTTKHENPPLPPFGKGGMGGFSYK